MIVEYQRPETITEALRLLARTEPPTFPMGGGTILNRPSEKQFAVVDLQALKLDGMQATRQTLLVGATVTLHRLLEAPGLPEGLRLALRSEGNFNLRQVSTLAGALVSAGGRSGLVTVLLAMDAQLEMYSPEQGKIKVKLGNWLPLRRGMQAGGLITQINLPLTPLVSYESISRTPSDLPIVCAGLVRWASGRTRLALGGWGGAPRLAMDGPEADGIEIAARNAYSHAGDQWASAEYRQEMAALLARRLLIASGSPAPTP